MANQVINNVVLKINELAEKGQLVEAKKLCEQFVQDNKKNSEAWFLLAELNNKTGDTKRAEANYRKVIKIKPDSAKAHTSLALLAHSAEKYSIALKGYKGSLSIDAQQPSLCFNIASIFLVQGLYVEAESYYQKAIKLKPDYAKAYANLGYVYRKLGDLNKSVEHYIKALEYEASIAEIHYNLGISNLLMDQLAVAEEAMKKAIELHPQYSDAWSGLGDIELQKENNNQAGSYYQKALSFDSQCVEALLGLSRVFSNNNEYDKSLSNINQALSIEPDNIEVYAELASVYLQQGYPDKSEEVSKNILKNNPLHYKSVIQIANAMEKSGDYESAHKYLKPLLANEDVATEAAVVFSLIAKKVNEQDQAVKILEVVKEKTDKNHVDYIRINFALGKLYDSIEDYENAYSCYEEANQLKNINFEIESYRQDISHIIDICSNDKIKKRKNVISGSHSTEPVFIVGMPRSGTSLVEQILASHSKVYGAGELPYINMLVQSMKDQQSNVNYAVDYDDNELNLLAEKYFSQIADVPPGVTSITDKMPANYLYLGLINNLFPKAKIIHCIRDPLDTCLSCYFQDFSVEHPYIYDLESVGQVYLEYQRIMKHWNSVLKIPMLHVVYEDLIENQDKVTRDIVSFCELEWEDACLDFHNNKRFIWTASYDQVRIPIYNKSVERWKNYRNNIGRLIDVVGSSDL